MQWALLCTSLMRTQQQKGTACRRHPPAEPPQLLLAPAYLPAASNGSGLAAKIAAAGGVQGVVPLRMQGRVGRRRRMSCCSLLRVL
jgi:hypothetical protein